MGWTFSDLVAKPVVKQDGKCRKSAMHKFCPYWMAKHSKASKDKVLGYKCSLFNKDKVGYASLPECNAEYGLTYDGPPHL